MAKRALVTGGAGLIGSHVVDLLVREGWQVRALDNLEPQTHRRGKPSWINEKAEFIEADLRDRAAITAALDGIELVFHQAAYGGYMPEIAKFVHVNSLGTAQMLEVIREKKLPIKKIVVASSQAVYSEGAGECPQHGLIFPSVRPIEQLQRGDWQVHCPICGAITNSVSTPESAPVGGETVYALTKVDQERLVLPRRNASSDQRHQTRTIRRLQTNCRSHRRHCALHRLDPRPIRHSRLFQRSERNFEEQGHRSPGSAMNIATRIPDFHASVVDHARKDFPLLDASMKVGETLERIRREGVGERVIYFYAVDEQ